jgi:thiol-disulfide isomerase/thioredoxin
MQTTAKKCPSCRQTDVTDFSTCRYCHTRYDAVIKQSGRSLDFKVVAFVCLFVVAMGSAFYVKQLVVDARIKQMAPLAASVKAAHRPRVMEFYAHWCGACNYYEPILLRAQSKYQSNIDFQRLDVDDPGTQEKAQMVGVSSIPRTCIFDRNGNVVFDRPGVLSQTKLDNILDSL